MREWPRLLAVLSRARDPHAPPDPRCQREPDQLSDNGWRWDRYVPAKPSGVHLVLLHGWTLLGKEDPRLMAFARSLAVAGVTCAVPTLPGLADLRFDPADVRGLRTFLQDQGHDAGVVGFSLGGTYALLAAAASSPRFVLTLSSPGDLPRLYAYWDGWGKAQPKARVAQETWLYMKLVLAWRRREHLPFTAADATELESLLRGYCEGGNREKAWAFYQRALASVDLEALDRAHQDPADLRVLSPSDHPPALACPVAILHDTHDEGVPSDHAARIQQAVRQGAPTAKVDTLVTELFQHVSPKMAFRPREIAKLLNLLSPLVRV